LTFFADRLWSLQLFRVWAQISATFVAFLLLATAITARISRWTRGSLVLGAILLIIAAIDSIDGKQDVLPRIVLALAMWGLLLAADTRTIIHYLNRQSMLHWIGCLAGVAATGLYLCGAVYYFILNIIQGPLDYDRHPLYAIGIIIGGILRIIRTTMERQSSQ
jgi:hypothetical protein